MSSSQLNRHLGCWVAFSSWRRGPRVRKSRSFWHLPRITVIRLQMQRRSYPINAAVPNSDLVDTDRIMGWALEHSSRQSDLCWELPSMLAYLVRGGLRTHCPHRQGPRYWSAWQRSGGLFPRVYWNFHMAKSQSWYLPESQVESCMYRVPSGSSSS